MYDFNEPTLTFQILSDIHLENRSTIPQVKAQASVCLLAGDIGYPYQPLYTELLADLSQKFELVILISGNHEYYNRKYAMSRIDQHIQEVCQGFPNVVFLQNSSIRIRYGPQEKTIRVWGATFWTNIPPELFGTIRGGMTDYSKITHYQHSIEHQRRYPISPFDVTRFHQDSVNALQQELRDDPDSPLIVMTHHLPSRHCHLSPKDELSRAYYSDEDDLIKPPITHWITGHDHTPLDIMINGVRCLRNPVGYDGPILREMVITLP